MNIKFNKNFEKLQKNYLFSEISARTQKFRKTHPKTSLISLGIGDVTLPLSPCVSKEMARAASEMGTAIGFRGYGDTLGDAELRYALTEYYSKRNVSLNQNEIFVSDGAKSDLSNLTDVLGDNDIIICDPVYPVYLDSNVMAGRRIKLIAANKENIFTPSPKSLEKHPYVIYLCSPNNPTGSVFSKYQLREWVRFAKESGSLIIFDAAYESFISGDDIPHSIFEIEGAKDTAVEIDSFSKMAGFTGVRCGWTVIPESNPLHSLWKRRQNTKFNGASYISQRGALAALSVKGISENQKNINYYMENAGLLAKLLQNKSIFFTGGIHAPYLWAECPPNISSWEFFDILLENTGIITTPGIGFGKNGEGYVRLSAFASRENIREATERLDMFFDSIYKRSRFI